ncbi:MAG: hypothetical protein FJW39_16625 [Acidobacteria bacterium]|nr:hypothetical protein [Acidobacteriota bacterium]
METLQFRVSKLSAQCAGVPMTWQGRSFDSGPLMFDLDESSPSGGVLDYALSRARAEFHVKIRFPEFAAMLSELGADGSLTRPVQAVVRSEGPIAADHSFALSGAAAMEDHAMFPARSTAASVLPGT